MKCDIKVSHIITEQDKAKLLKKWGILVLEAKDNGIFIHPDGHFDGKATGSIKLTDTAISIDITDKPFYIPEQVIKSELSKLINGWLDG